MYYSTIEILFKKYLLFLFSSVIFDIPESISIDSFFFWFKSHFYASVSPTCSIMSLLSGWYKLKCCPVLFYRTLVINFPCLLSWRFILCLWSPVCTETENSIAMKISRCLCQWIFFSLLYPALYSCLKLPEWHLCLFTSLTSGLVVPTPPPPPPSNPHHIQEFASI